MSQQIGFNFQGDVFLGSSLVFTGAGRLLKLFSDAGEDIYAVAAILELGKQVPISQHHETIVSAALLKRQNSRAGFLAQSLRIGWGCNDAAYELSRTREGSAALMLADAFAAGRCLPGRASFTRLDISQWLSPRIPPVCHGAKRTRQPHCPNHARQWLSDNARAHSNYIHHSPEEAIPTTRRGACSDSSVG